MASMKLTVVAVTAFSSLGLLSAATLGIGIAMSQGNIIINSSQTAGNATIFDGSTLETTAASSQVRLNGGAQLRLASESRGTVYADHVNLEKGSARIAGYSANANGLNVRADGKSSATVSMRDQGVVEIAALTGNVHVFNAAGMTVANLLPGRALDLRPQDAGASAPPPPQQPGAGGAGGGGAAGAASGASTTTLVIAGVAVAAAVGTAIGVAVTSSTNPTVSSGRLGAFN